MIKQYMDFLYECKHEYQCVEYIKRYATLFKGYEIFDENKEYTKGDKIIFEFKNKLIALVELGNDISEGVNMIVSHLDSPRLDVIPNNPFVEKDDGIFMKVIPYGGIISQLWLDRPLTLIGKAYNNKGEEVFINTENEYMFTITSLLPHLNGRKEVKDLTYDKLMVRVGDNVFKYFEIIYGLTKENLQLADLSFVPNGKPFEIGFDKEFISSYGQDDRSSVFASMKALFDSRDNNKTKIALFTSYEENGSQQSSGAISQFIDDIFLELANGNQLIARRSMRNTKAISGDVCASYDSVFAKHFEENAKAISGKGVAIVPSLNRGNHSTLEIKEHIRRLCVDNEIQYQIEQTKSTESGGNTVSSYFATRGIDVIDIGIPILAMHSPNELAHKNDFTNMYKLYKVFFEK